MSEPFVRKPEYPIDPMFTQRWSPRAFDGSPLAEEQLMRLFEAARWAPSAYNIQPWRVCYSLRGDAAWEKFLDLLIPFNRGWAESASALIFMVSDRMMRGDDGKAKGEGYSHSFDTGAAWAQLSLQARIDGLYTHGMTGFDTDRAPGVLGLTDEYRVEAAAAIGRLGDPASLPENLRGREGPSDRRPLNEIAFHGGLATD